MTWLRFQDELNKPYYFLRPKQVFLRLKRRLLGYRPDATRERIILPWGLPIWVHPTDVIGNAIFRAGVYDLCVSEVLWRLIDPTETAIDAGANIGHMTSIMAKRVSETGRVLSFEPHPQVFQELAANAATWQPVPNIGKIEIYEIGLSKDAGTATLHTTSEFTVNRGTASLEITSEDDADQGMTHSISTERLDNMISNDAWVGIMKIDVEGHEMDMLQGATSLLKERRIRDIVFEEKNSYPSRVTQYLEQFGYSIFSIEQGPFAVRVSPANLSASHYKYEPQNYLATLDSERALERLSKIGYQSLRTHEEDSETPVLSRIIAGLILVLAAWFFVNKARRNR